MRTAAFVVGLVAVALLLSSAGANAALSCGISEFSGNDTSVPLASFSFSSLACIEQNTTAWGNKNGSFLVGWYVSPCAPICAAGADSDGGGAVPYHIVRYGGASHTCHAADLEASVVCNGTGRGHASNATNHTSGHPFNASNAFLTLVSAPTPDPTGTFIQAVYNGTCAAVNDSDGHRCGPWSVTLDLYCDWNVESGFVVPNQNYSVAVDPTGAFVTRLSGRSKHFCAEFHIGAEHPRVRPDH
jgi:hypothetical protein